MSDTEDTKQPACNGTAVVSMLTAPTLTSFSHEVLVEWKTKWKKFLRDLEEECRRQERDFKSATPSITSLTVPADLIQAMARRRIYLEKDG
jgi:hypothetical protein